VLSFKPEFFFTALIAYFTKFGQFAMSVFTGYRQTIIFWSVTTGLVCGESSLVPLTFVFMVRPFHPNYFDFAHHGRHGIALGYVVSLTPVLKRTHR
jgi:hypothetical protein